jgi:hypothetical protein
MNTLEQGNQNNTPKQPATTKSKKAAYTAPALVAHGTLQEITQNTSGLTNVDAFFGFQLIS